ncbi:bifunctional alpha/beta hydrolase/class I SAM-dependent methyltransferase [Suttonella sp. R2A3]|uniref:bifunctional alpha/beta hydrolase/class I SAM-dependent methyltransferase n=1 Tax=Suttonella sp. R2A3 TaxID=2908648 RepID=UPI001F3DEAA3|nr:bifunctional alpha/beta hydrolase/class I SAM-dependent methyltransferase [Suttonella sp. R2A3]UJF24904.1 bifunctional alpha/beta hydrolase/class I SAM-dependent methyltransferase [Suttonella sp. R2A3]
MNEQQQNFVSHDGAQLFYRYRPPASGRTEKALILFHRGHEHSARMMHVGEELNLEDTAIFAWDARGHGHSPGERGDSPSIDASVADVEAFVRYIERTYDIDYGQMVVIGQSVGAVLVAGWLHDYAPKIRAVVLASPAFKVKLYVPFARPGLRLMQRLRGNFFVNSYVKAHYLTHDQARIDSFNNDPLIARAISVRILLGLHRLAKRVVADAQAITVPIQLLISGDDWVVSHQPQHQFFNHLGSADKERHVLPGFYHDTLGERDRAQAIDLMRTFIERQFATPYAPVSVTDADERSVSRVRADKLATPLAKWSPRGMYWRAYRAALRFGARWSQGLAVGRDAGFDSGATLDYVYQNQPSGTNAFGRFIDKQYLSAIGWRGIRGRKRHIQVAINEAFACLEAAGKEKRVLDIAAGHGRYVLDALLTSHHPEQVLLQDFSEANVAAGGKLIAERGLSETVTFVQGDAFDRAAFADHPIEPTLGIVSGLHELFSDNTLVLQSLYGFADIISEGGYLIYTAQPWHPQQEMIGRALSSHRAGQPWVMRCRSQQEMDQLVEQAGFVKYAQWSGEDGIFTVTLAKRV